MKYQEKLTLLDLLPMTADARIDRVQMEHQVISFLHFLAVSILEAIHCFCDTEAYHLLDPHVGETSCQIRAYHMLLLVSHRRSVVPRLRGQLSKLIQLENRLDKVSAQLSETRYLGYKGMPVKDFIANLKCNSLEVDTLTALMGIYVILTCFTMKEQGRTVTNYTAIANQINISNKRAKAFVHHLQRIVADHSVKQIFKWSDKSNIPVMSSRLFHKLIRFDDNNRPVLPCYFLTKTILLHFMQYQNKHALLLVAKSKKRHGVPQETFILPFVPQGNRFTLVTMDQLPSDTVCFVIKGDTIYRDENQFIHAVLDIGITNVILANMAAHPQYSGNKQRQYTKSPFNDASCYPNVQEQMEVMLLSDELDKLFTRAEKLGCGKYANGLFSIKHMTCDHYLRQASLHENTVALEMRLNTSVISNGHEAIISQHLANEALG